jgi:cyclophilin family peptidyl-prolyl cis-trans isomerase
MALWLLVASCGGSEDTAAGGSPTTTETPPTSQAAAETTTTEALPEITLPVRPPSDYAGFVAQATACGADAPTLLTPMAFAAPEDQGLDPATTVQATIITSCGDIVVELDPGIAPDTVNSFVFLARQGYFDGSVSHRIVPGFVLQAGDPTATGREGPGYTIKDELPAAGFLYERGVLAMANSGPDSGGSQFFIVLADAGLNNDFSHFGRVVEGFEALDRIAELPLGPNAFGEVSVPLETLYIEQVIVTP